MNDHTPQRRFISSFFLLALMGLCSSSGNFAAECFAEESSFFSVADDVTHAVADNVSYEKAVENGKLANEGLRRCRHYVQGWLKLADPKTGLIPRNNKQFFWNAKDAAADNYPFMVLTSWFVDRELLDGKMLDILKTETRLTARVDSLPDTFDFKTQKFSYPEMDIHRVMFGASEYIKDGLLPLTEWLGPSPWSDRMIGLLDDMWKNAPFETPVGKIVSNNVEVNGEMLQVLSRVYWMTGDEKYLDWACRLGDYYLLGDHHPTKNFSTLRLRDHGCEIVSGLCELYATVHFARPEKKIAYQKPIHDMLDRILEVGTNHHGMLYNKINPITGETIPPGPKGKGLADTWGYTYNGIYTVYLIDGTKAYRDATRKVLSNLDANYRNYAWEGPSSDGYADSIESGLNLLNREPSNSVEAWLDSQIHVMWAKQQPSGRIEGWHGDGNFARTSIMYCLWKSQGLSIQPWREDVCLGAVRDGDGLKIAIQSEKPWSGRIFFDRPRHKTVLKLPIDWPRINQFPEWFTVQNKTLYHVTDNKNATTTEYSGATFANDGLRIELKGAETLLLQVR